MEHANERYKLLESNCTGLKREATALRDKSEKLSLTCAKLETSHETAKQELSEVKEKLMRNEVCDVSTCTSPLHCLLSGVIVTMNHQFCKQCRRKKYEIFNASVISIKV